MSETVEDLVRGFFTGIAWAVLGLAVIAAAGLPVVLAVVWLPDPWWLPASLAWLAGVLGAFLNLAVKRL